MIHPDGQEQRPHACAADGQVFLYKAPAGDTSLRSFAFNRILFSGGYVPSQFWSEQSTHKGKSLIFH